MHSLTGKILLTGSMALMSIAQSCHSSEEKKEEKKEQKAAVIASTEVFLLEKGKLSSSLQIPGELIAFQQVDLYAKVSSFVKKLYADVGTQVKQGDLLATMEAPEINAQLAGAESKLKSMEALYIASKANYERLLETSKTPGTISPNDLDMALARQNSDYAQLQAAKASYKEITDTRNYLEIRAPFSGIISARNVSAGAYVGPAGKGSELPIFSLQEQTKLRLVVAIPEAYTGLLSNKNEVSFTVKSLAGQKFTARVARLAGALDNRLRSERIEMDVVNSSRKLLPGMIAEINIPLSANDSTFVVPRTAVVNSAQKIFVVKVLNNKAVLVDVKKGREAGDKAEIFGSNLLVGDTLVTTGNEEFRNNAVIHAVKKAGL